MSNDKAILHGKLKRAPYYRNKAMDKMCRCHGGCPYCLGNRMHKHKLRVEIADEQIKEVLNGLRDDAENEEQKDGISNLFEE